ncbi:MAG: hypothetical protein WA190_06140 [Usitatibacter sp.]
MKALYPLATLLLLGAASNGANAYCIYNDTRDRDVKLLQEMHPDALRDDRKMNTTIKPGTKICCEVKQLDCNPEGSVNSSVNFDTVHIEGTPTYACVMPEGAKQMKIPSAGTVRIQPNPRKGSAFPYVVRVMGGNGHDITPPNGVNCVEWTPPPEPEDPKAKGRKK